MSFPYDPILVEKVKTIDGRRWHPAEKHWSFPKADGILETILKVFGDEDIRIDPSFKTAASKVNPAPMIRCGVKGTPSPLVGEGSPSLPSPLVGEGQGEGYDFEDLRRELVSRKYSYNTVKGYIYYNRDFLDFADKEPSEVNDDDIKDYLLYLVQKKKNPPQPQ